jgi:hypothetical protein
VVKAVHAVCQQAINAGVSLFAGGMEFQEPDERALGSEIGRALLRHLMADDVRGALAVLAREQSSTTVAMQFPGGLAGPSGSVASR